ncbi:MAG: YigZ family protein [Bacteroidales bacterium]
MPMIDDVYRTIASRSQSVFRDKGSRFIGHVIPVSSPDEIRSELENLRREYHDARHHCYAWRLGAGGESWRINDDGEPSGSAGKPIYGQLLSHEISDVLAVVVRYFGGTKLGIPGLINAYKTTTREAIEAASITEKVLYAEFEVGFGYSAMNQVMRIVREQGIEIIRNDFNINCLMHARIRKADLASVAELFRNIGKVQFTGIPDSRS